MNPELRPIHAQDAILVLDSCRATPVSLDLESVLRAAKGDAKAQAWLAARVLPAVRRVTRSLATCAADSDDAVQLTLLEVLRSARTYRGLASVDAWASRIATRVTLRVLTQERRRQQRTTDVQVDGIAHEAPPTSLCESIPHDLRFYIAQLPMSQRNALVLRHALGYSIDEIAEMTEVSRNTVKSRLRLGGATLHKMLRRDRKLAEWGSHADDT